jgi:F0F1-type ATP synthase epsilon subunit
MADTQPQSNQAPPHPTQPVQQPVEQPVTLVEAEKIHVTVRNRTQILFNDDVKSLTSKNDTGIFDILPEHANFISLIGGSLIIGKMDGQKQEIPVRNGVIKVKDNAIYCYIDLISKEANLKPQPTATLQK